MQERETSAGESGLGGFALLIALLVVATAAAALAFNGNPVLTLAPLLASIGIYALWKLPLRVSLLVLMFVGLTFENPSDVPANNLWKSPLYGLGKLLLGQLKHSLPIGGLVMTGSDLILALLVLIYVRRRVAGSEIDRRGLVRTPRPLLLAAFLAIGMAAAMWLWGAARGGENRFAMWQFHHVAYLPVMFLFMQLAIPGVESQRSFARVIVVAASLKALLAIYVRHLFPDVEYATTHHDSMLFALAGSLLGAHLLEHLNGRTLLKCVPLLGLLACGMMANDRRLVWVQVGVAAVFMFLLMRRTRLKVFIARSIIYSVPILLLYVAVGWSSSSGVFSPVGTLRSMVDSQVDRSSEWRDLENFNLVSTLISHPLVGPGFGHPFEQAVKLPDVVSSYELEPYLPHNSAIGIWAYTGYVGFSAIWMMLALTVYFASRAYRHARAPDDRTAAMTSLCMVAIYAVHLYGDMALGSWTSIYLVALSMVVAGKTAVKVGAWPGMARAPQLRRVGVEQVTPRRLRLEA